MKKIGLFTVALFLILLLRLSSGLQIIGEQQLIVNTTINKTKEIPITLYNDANQTFQANISLVGNVTSVASLLNNSVTIDPFSLATIYIKVKATQEGFWLGNLTIKNTTLPIKITCKRFHKIAWYQAGQKLEIQPGDYSLQIENVSNGAFIVVSQHGYVINGRFYSIGQGFSTSDFGFNVLDAYNNIVKLEIYSNYLSTTVSVSKASTTGFGGFTFYTTQYANTIATDSEIKETFILRNGLNKPVVLKKIEYSGTVITKNGRQPINAIQYQLGTLQPGEETSIVVDINTKDLSPGVWTPILTVKGLTQDNQIVSASINFVLTITQAVKSPSPENLTISYPKQVVANKDFNITISGLSSEMAIDMQPNEHLIGTNVNRTSDKWIWTGHIDTNETQTVVIYVKLLGGIFKTFKFNLTVPQPPKPVTIIAPDKLWVGDILHVTTNPSNAKIEINGTPYSENFTFLLPGTYVIKASANGYKTGEKTINVISPVKANYTKPIVGKEVIINFDKFGNYEVKYKNEVISSVTHNKILTFTPEQEGAYYVYDDMGHLITIINAKKTFAFSLPKLSLIDYIIISLLVVIVILVVYFFKKRKKGGLASHWEMTPAESYPVEESV